MSRSTQERQSTKRRKTPASHQLFFHHRPSVLLYMVQALYPSPGIADGYTPSISARWSCYQIRERAVESFDELTGLDSTTNPIIFMQAYSFPLLMAILTHRKYPLPIWRSLQVRTRIVQHMAFSPDTVTLIQARLGQLRSTDRGVEIDLHTTAECLEVPKWESTTTFYYRGAATNADCVHEPVSPPATPQRETAQWQTPTHDTWRLSRLTGDFNGIHTWSWYARRLGFQRSSHHTQLLVGQCMAHLAPPTDYPQNLDIWYRGPVYRSSQVTLHTSNAEDTAFALVPDHDDRAALVGRWST